jgi:hypothetical protein
VVDEEDPGNRPKPLTTLINSMLRPGILYEWHGEASKLVVVLLVSRAFPMVISEGFISLIL